MLNNKPDIIVGNYQDKSYYVDSKPIAGTSVFGGKADVTLKAKEPAKPKHAVLIGAAIVAGIIFLSYKLDERF